MSVDLAPSTNSTTVRATARAPQSVRIPLALLSRLSPALAARLMGRLFMRPPPPRPLRPELAQALQSGTRTQLSVGDHRVTAWRWGSSSRRALLVHGWGGRGSQLWPFVQPLRDRGFEVWMIDTPAHGESGGRALVLPHKAALLQDLAEQLGGIHGLVAHSFGAAAAALASRRAPLADRMGLIAPPGDVRHFTRMFGEALGFSPRVHDLVNDLYEQQYGVTFESLRADAVSMTQPMPTLLVHDTDDEAVPVEHVEWLHEAWSGTRLLRTSGLGHKGVLRDPAVVDEVVQFVAG